MCAPMVGMTEPPVTGLTYSMITPSHTVPSETLPKFSTASRVIAHG